MQTRPTSSAQLSGRHRILIAEDEAIVARDIAVQLREMGYEVAAHCARGEDALEQAARLRPDLILMDVQLAGAMDGITAAEHVRAQLHLPVVFLTAFAESETVNRAKKAEPYGYIIKPFDDRELHTVVEMALFKHRAEARLRESEERLRVLVESSIDAVLVTVPTDEGRILAANAAACAMFQLTEEEMKRCGRSGLVDATDPRLRPAMEERTRTGRFRGEITMVRANGERFPAEIAAAVFHMSDGTECSSMVIRDGTERRRAEQALRHSEERYRLMFDNNPLPMWLFDCETLRILAVNETAVQAYGYSREEFLAKTVLQLQPDEDQARFRDFLRTVRHSPQNTAEWRHLRKDGSVIPVETVSRPLVYENREARLVIASDISEKKQLQERFLRAQRLESLGMLAAGIAHDLNNVLAPIVMAVPILQQRVTDPRDQRLLAALEHSGERGAGLVKQILGFAHGIGGEPRLVQVKHLLRDMGHIVRETFPRSIVLEEEIPTDLWPVTANPTQIHQVLLNLCVNARDAMPDGGTLRLLGQNCLMDAITARQVEGVAPGRWLKISVEDTGCGMTPDVKARMFEPFFTTKGEGKGTGLGLPTVLGIVKSHHGAIELETRPGEGTKFRIYLPVAAAVSAAPAVAPTAAQDGHGECILVVDDDAAIRDICASVLIQHGYRVLTAGDGSEATDVFARHAGEVKVVITDIDMPVMDGMMLARVLLKMNPDLRVAVATGLEKTAAGTSRLRGLTEIGVRKMLNKPFTVEELLTAVKDLLASR